jgi:hypothetical protein
MPPKDRKFKPGHRSAVRYGSTGKISENRFAWLRLYFGQFQIMKYEIPEEEEEREVGANITLYIPRPGTQSPLSLNMTALTSEELQAMREFFELLFTEVEPVIADRDRIANDALAKGDDSYARVYRQVPQFIVRQRPERTDSPSVHDGSEDVSSGSGGDVDPDDRVRGLGDELADGEPEEVISEDDREAPY